MVKKYNLNILKNNKEAIDIISYLARIRFNGLSRNEKLKDNTSIKKKDINAYCKEYGFATVDGIYKELGKNRTRTRKILNDFVKEGLVEKEEISIVKGRLKKYMYKINSNIIMNILNLPDEDKELLKDCIDYLNS